MHVVILCKSLWSQHCGFIKPLEDSTHWSATAALSKQCGIRFFHILFFFTLQWAPSLPVVMCVRGLYFLRPGWSHTKFMDCRGDKHLVTKRLRPTLMSRFLPWQHTAVRRDDFAPFLLLKYVRSDVPLSQISSAQRDCDNLTARLVWEHYNAAAAAATSHSHHRLYHLQINPVIMCWDM